MSDHGTFNVRQFGAAGVARPTETLKLENFRFGWLSWPEGLTATVYHPAEGAEYDSQGIQRAIDAAHAAGGGTVVVPAGDYLIGPFGLRSRVRLHLEPGARLWGSPYLADYRCRPDQALTSSVDQGFGRKARGLSGSLRRLITAVDAEDVAITGTGQISAQSPRWVIPWLNSRPKDWISERPTDTFLFYRCRSVRVEGIRILDTPAWTLVFDNCRHVQVRGLRIECLDVLNSDGIDLVNTSHATISDCDIRVTDDGICLKNMQPDTTMGNVAVTNCLIRTLCNGLKIGTNTEGNFQDITFSNIVIHNPDDDVKGAEGGVNLCALDGGWVRNVSVSNVVMRNVECPFYLVGGCREKTQKHYRTPRPGLMERISLSNIRADGARHTCFIVGHENQPIRDIDLTNVRIRKTDGFYSQPPGPLREPDRYPTPYMFGSRQGDELPACGLFLRDVRQIDLRDFRVDCLRPDVRPCISAERCDAVTGPDGR